MAKLNKEWIKLAGEYESAVNAVRRADHDREISDEEYTDLVGVREVAFTKLKNTSPGGGS